jgi:hypothetical protein
MRKIVKVQGRENPLELIEVLEDGRYMMRGEDGSNVILSKSKCEIIKVLTPEQAWSFADKEAKYSINQTFKDFFMNAFSDGHENGRIERDQEIMEVVNRIKKIAIYSPQDKAILETLETIKPL